MGERLGVAQHHPAHHRLHVRVLVVVPEVHVQKGIGAVRHVSIATLRSREKQEKRNCRLEQLMMIWALGHVGLEIAVVTLFLLFTA